MPGMIIAYAIEYRGYYILSYPTGFGDMAALRLDLDLGPGSAKAVDENKRKRFTEGWLVKKGEVKFYGFRPAPLEKVKK